MVRYCNIFRMTFGMVLKERRVVTFISSPSSVWQRPGRISLRRSRREFVKTFPQNYNSCRHWGYQTPGHGNCTSYFLAGHICHKYLNQTILDYPGRGRIIVRLYGRIGVSKRESTGTCDKMSIFFHSPPPQNKIRIILGETSIWEWRPLIFTGARYRSSFNTLYQGNHFSY